MKKILAELRSTAAILVFLAFAAATLSGQQAGSCSGITPGFSVFTGGSFNGFVPWTASSGWNQNISSMPIDSRSPAWVETLRATVDRRLRLVYPLSITEGWGGPWEGIPFHVVGQNQPRVEVRYTAGESYPEDTDPGPFPIPFYPRVQGAFGPGSQVNYAVPGDKHVIVVDRDACLVYELWNVNYTQGKVVAGTGAVYDMLSGDHQRPYFKSGGGSVSGLPYFAGAIRYDEILAGEITHPIAFTALPYNRSVSFTGMASHHQYRSGDFDPGTPPFGVKLRLRSDFDISGYTAQNQIVLRALKKYGMVMVDGGLTADLLGATDKRWDYNSVYEMLAKLFLTSNGDFQAVQTGPIYCDPQYHCGAQPPVGPLPVINSFTSSSPATKSGAPVTLQWSVSGVPSRIRFISPGIGPVVTDSVVVSPAATTTYTLMVQNESGRSTQTVTVVVTASGNPLTPLYVGAKLVSGATSMRVNVTNPNAPTVTNQCSASPCPVGVDTSLSGYQMQIQHISAKGQVLAISDTIPLTVK
jgi:hypothetical protein